MKKIVLAAALTAAALAPTAAPASAQEAPAEEVWAGSVDLSSAGAGALEFTVRFVWDETGAVSATITIPAQGATDLPLSDVEYGDEVLAFTLVTRPNSAVFRAERDGDEAAGTLQQGLEFPLELHRAAEGEAAGPARPQHPTPPFPYASEEVSYTNEADGAVLAGTLTLPEGPGPHPAALLITGSGSQDRDETIFAHKPFWVIADHLTRAGVAVLRVDDRGVGGSSGPLLGTTSDDYAGDVLTGVRFLAGRADIDDGRIGLIGHSEGGLIAPMVASRAPDEVAWIVMLAGTGIPGAELMPLQLGALLRAGGVPEESVTRQVAIQEKMIAQLLDGAADATIRASVDELVDVQMEGASEAQRAARDQAVDVAFQQVTSPWYRRFLALDPREALEGVRAPVLALNGTLDLQVPAEPNLSEIEKALREGGNDRVTTVALPGLNHLFQTAGTGSASEYGIIEETFAPAALELMTDWILAQVQPH